MLSESFIESAVEFITNEVEKPLKKEIAALREEIAQLRAEMNVQTGVARGQIAELKQRDVA